MDNKCGACGTENIIIVDDFNSLCRECIVDLMQDQMYMMSEVLGAN
jgi:hypothetical protein